MKDLSEENPDLEVRISSIMETGNELDEAGNKLEALAAYEQAWALLPEPRLGWKLLTGWIAGSFYNFYFDAGDFKTAKYWAQITLDGRSSERNTAPLIDLGMVCVELHEEEKAFQYFDAAYAFGKERAFKERPKKYLKFYLDKKKKGE
ncbi:hypothetical protein GCM10009091_17830 [Pseudomonas brenneri]|uniref:Tetratricopeptide repeat protein n=1 Tax=Pseudomonas brenneri TaxID=129817 RepID=A0A5B2V1D0_9PSED|nr:MULTISPECIES: hypothetical protein [Pseudomonas]KAA2232568.1 hypothetical protein F1720_03200 [Pseudomonas brenneri]NMZ07994.1 hypothetical protein [Pseudomonas proteolytica]TWR78137.1 hypothetical protein FJD34_15780 [Pseudomonas brenneri]SDV08481.1 hypothetical protein SAMN04490181_4459 [Pseudomonas brenneri]GGL36262.1 hypothetical protein GCM10009091_17830 [Pseudomonas brenneri]